jgi:hypothetical protein
LGVNYQDPIGYRRRRIVASLTLVRLSISLVEYRYGRNADDALFYSYLDEPEITEACAPLWAARIHGGQSICPTHKLLEYLPTL